jgi:tRNA pseudouridine-54 N-methylase
MKLLGNRIYLEMPKKEDSKLIVDENTKEALQKELLKNMNRLKVHSVGTAITDPDLKVGVYVLVDPVALRDKTLVVPISDTEDVLLVSIFDIVHIW